MPDERVKLFISHASEDKLTIADSLAEALKAEFEVWYDRFSLTLGDSLHGKISEGLRQSDFGVVILSKNFFAKKWPQNELDGLLSLEDQNRKVILPIWHRVTENDVKGFSSILAGRLGMDSSKGIPAIIDEIKLAINAARKTASFGSTDNFRVRLRQIESEIIDEQKGRKILCSYQGVGLVHSAAETALNALVGELQEAGRESTYLKFAVINSAIRETRVCQGFSGPFNLTFIFDYSNSFSNTAETAHLNLGIWRIERDIWGDITTRHSLEAYVLNPKVESNETVLWSSTDGTVLTNEQIPKFSLDIILRQLEAAYQKPKKS